MRLLGFLLVLPALLLSPSSYTRLAGDIATSPTNTAAGSTFRFRSPTSSAKEVQPDLATSSTDTSTASLTGKNRHLTCHPPPFTVTDMDGFKDLVASCVLIREAITWIGIFLHEIPDHEEPSIRSALRKQLFALAIFTRYLEHHPGCQTSGQEIHCTWLRQLRGDVAPSLAGIRRKQKATNIGGRECKHEGQDSCDVTRAALERVCSVVEETTAEILALELRLLGLSLGQPVLYEEFQIFGNVFERAEDLEADLGCFRHGQMVVCIALRMIRKSAEPIPAVIKVYQRVMRYARDGL